MKVFLVLLAIAGAAQAVPPGPIGKTPQPVKLPAASKEPAKVSPEEMKKRLYAFGVSMANRTPLASMSLTPAELEVALTGYADAVQGKKLLYEVDVAVDPRANQKLTQLVQERQQAYVESVRAKNAEPLAKAAAEPNAVKLPSGAILVVATPGAGSPPNQFQPVKLSYRGTFIDGSEFDSNVGKDVPPVQTSRLIPCMAEAVGRLGQGGKAKVTCPPSSAFGAQGRPPAIPPEAIVTFQLEVVEILAPQPPEMAPVPGAPQ